MKLIKSAHFTNILILILLILMIGVLKFSSFKNFSAQLYSDNAIYAILTSRFVMGDWEGAVHIWWQPLYPFLASLIFPLTKSVESALFYVSVISGILLIIPVFLITYGLTKSTFASIAAALLSTFNIHLVKSYFNLLTENLYILLLMTSILFGLLIITRKKIIYAFGYGFIMGLGYIARSDILLPFQIFILFLILYTFFRKEKWRNFIKISGFTILVFFITISPYLYFNYQEFGSLNLSAKLNAVKNMPAYFSPQFNETTTFAQDVWSIDTPNYDSDFFNKPFPYWRYRNELWESSRDRFYGYMRLFQSEDDDTFINLAILGFIVSAYYFFKKYPAGLLLHLTLLLGFLLSLPFQPGVDYRYAFWTYPIFSIFIVMLVFIISRIIWTLKNKILATIVILVLNLVFFSFFYNLNKNNIVSSGEFQKKALDNYQLSGEYIKTLGKKDPRIMTRREVVGYYADGVIIYIPSSFEMDQLERYAKLWRVNYIVADRFTFPPDTPLFTLMNETKAPDWLIPIKIWEKDVTKTIIYEVKLD